MCLSKTRSLSYPLLPELALLLDPLWKFLALADPPVHADVIFVFGSQDLQVPRHAASLYRSGYAATVLVTGHYGRMTRDDFEKPEALVFKDVLVRAGVPPRAIVAESTARNTLENVTRGLFLLRQKKIICRSVLLVAKPFVMRRCAATFTRQAPDVRVSCCPYTEDMAASIDRPPSSFARRLVEELDRIDRYATKGDIERQQMSKQLRRATQNVLRHVGSN